MDTATVVLEQVPEGFISWESTAVNANMEGVGTLLPGLPCPAMLPKAGL